LAVLPVGSGSFAHISWAASRARMVRSDGVRATGGHSSAAAPRSALPWGSRLAVQPSGSVPVAV
jgi:hypothetical protein